MLAALLLIAAAIYLYRNQLAGVLPLAAAAVPLDPALAWQGGAMAPGPVPAGRVDPNDALAIINRVNTDEGLGLDPRDVLAVIAAESSFAPGAVGSSGELGLMQVLPATARDRGIDPATLTDPETGIRAGMRQLAWTRGFLRARLGREPTELETFGAYNAGVGNVLNGYVNTPYYSRIARARDGITVS